MAEKRRKWKLWIAWLAGATALSVYLAWTLLEGEDKTVFMPGPLSDGHHQLALACDSCHSSPLGGTEVLEEACVACHGDVREKPFDSHPKSKFTDPRNADRLAKINALQCTTCHVEHRPEITHKDGFTIPVDFCVHCHADIGTERPSHAGMEFNSCKDSGCHNFHNNRALYTDFLIRHLHESPHLDMQRMPDRELGAVLEEILEYPHDRFPVTPLDTGSMDAPAEHADPQIINDWLETAHIRKGVTCGGCHLWDAANGDPAWTERPGPQACATCHGIEVERFQLGKHGMRLASGLPPMTPAEARLPMKDAAAHLEMNCNSCHSAHRFDTRSAAVEACLGCHDDQHSRAFPDSPHARLWEQELAGELPAGSGVSCASCHMPRVDFDVSDWLSRVMVDHNQSANLSPNSKMIRGTCQHCHGLGFTLDALADQDLIDRNFAGMPGVSVDSMRLAEKDHERALREAAEASAAAQEEEEIDMDVLDW